MTPLTMAAEIRQSHQSKHSVSLHSERTYQTASIMQHLWHTNVVIGIKLGQDGGIKIHDMTPLTLAAEMRQSHQLKHSVSLHSEKTYQVGSIVPFVTYASPATCQTNLERRHMVRRRHSRKKVTSAPIYQRMRTF